ncbi:MAG: hypothetical protein ACYC27_23070 [Armatimonadota bacterium]
MGNIISIDKTAILISDDQPRFVRRMAEDLASHIDRMGGNSTISAVLPTETYETVIIIGANTEIKAEIPAPPDKDQGYILAAIPGTPNIIFANGYDAEGTKWALVDLLLLMDGSEDGLSVPDDLHISAAPGYRLRGMYAHLHWSYKYPYALRTWSIDDWKRYVDFLSYLKVNLFQFWTMAAILPVPLSEGDKAYLQKYYEVVEYARNERGMTVIPGECANNAAKGDMGVPFEQRDYFEAEIVMDPNDPEQMEKVRESRAQMYKAVPNGDAYWIIDSDPGGWKGGTPEQFVNILKMNRELLAEVGNPNAKIYNWMAFGWGVGSTIEDWIASLDIKEKTWESVIACMKEQFPEPWGILAMSDAHLQAVANQGELERTISFPYGAVEHEPAPPHTHIRFNSIKDQIDSIAGTYPQLKDIMANAQTPFVQIPNIYSFHQLAWGAPDLTRESVLMNLAKTLFPENPKVLADAWSMIKPDVSPDEVNLAADALESAIIDGAMGRSGVAAMFLPSRGLMAASDLVIQLRAHAAVIKASELAKADAGEDAVFQALKHYLEIALTWQDRHGYHGATDRPRPLLAIDDNPFMNEAAAYLTKGDVEKQKEVASRLASAVNADDKGMAERLSKEITGCLWA